LRIAHGPYTAKPTPIVNAQNQIDSRFQSNFNPEMGQNPSSSSPRNILDGLGLTPQRVAELTRRDCRYAVVNLPPPAKKKYLDGARQRQVTMFMTWVHSAIVRLAQNGVSQSDLARGFGVSPAAIYKHTKRVPGLNKRFDAAIFEATRIRAIALLESGESYNEVATKTGVPLKTIYRWRPVSEGACIEAE